MILTIDVRHLKAAAICASDDPTRAYINGVQVEHTDHGTLLVATDGHILLAVKTIEPDAPAAPARVLIPARVCKNVKINKRQPAATLTLGADHTWTLTYDGIQQTWRANPNDAPFPEWRRVLPQHAEPGEPAYFDPALITRLAKAGDLIGDKFPIIVPDGNNPAWVRFEAVDGFGVIMPMRRDISSPMTRPAWA